MLWLCFVKKKKKPFYERCIEVFTNEMIHSLGFILEFSSKEMKKGGRDQRHMDMEMEDR